MSDYTYRRGARFTGNLDPGIVAEELTRIWAAHNQQLFPADVVEAARPEGAVLHPCFEWDDHTAAEEHRLYQARTIIRNVRVIENDDNKPFFIHVPKITTETKPFYQQVHVVQKEVLQYFAALKEARVFLEGAMQRFEDLRRLAVMEKREDKDLTMLAAVVEALSTASAIASRLQ